MRNHTADRIFGEHFYADLHARAPDVVHARVELDHLADMDGLDRILDPSPGDGAGAQFVARVGTQNGGE